MTLSDKFFKNLEKKIGMSVKEIKDANPEELDKRLVKNPFEGLNPHNYRDAKRIIKKYASMGKQYVDFCEAIPGEVIDARLTLSLH